MSATRENHWGELRAMLARPPVDFIHAYRMILAMRDGERAAAAHYVRSHQPAWSEHWFGRLVQIPGLNDTLEVWNWRLVVATAWQMSQELEESPPDVFLADLELKRHWIMLEVDEAALAARHRELEGDTGARQYHASIGGATYRALAINYLRSDPMLCTRDLHRQIAQLGRLDQWLIDIGARGMDAIERAGQRFERATRRVSRERNPLRGGAHLLSWAANEASRATESFLNLGPSMASSFNEGARAREERAEELEQLLMRHLFDTLEREDHLQL